MKIFLRNTFFFLIPLLALLFLEAHAIFGAKENITLIDAIALQKKDTALLVGYSLSYNEPQYKYISTTEKHPDILVLGTSRTMQIRKFFFDSAYSFYNAGGAVERINEYTNFLKSIHYNPKVLIIALDQYFFNRSWDDMSHNPKSYKYIAPSLTSLFLGNSQTIISDIFKRKIPLGFPDNNNIGLNGVVNGQGYRYDGSYDYNISGKRKEEQHDYLFSNTLDRIKNGNQRFEYASNINKDAVLVVIELIKYCKEKNIHLIAFLPPYAPTIWVRCKA